LPTLYGLRLSFGLRTHWSYIQVRHVQRLRLAAQLEELNRIRIRKVRRIGIDWPASERLRRRWLRFRRRCGRFTCCGSRAAG
jgi:hypothetical protein